MIGLKPLLVIDRDTGKLCIQVRLGSLARTCELPDNLASASVSELQAYFDGVVPNMIRDIREESRKISKKMGRIGK